MLPEELQELQGEQDLLQIELNGLLQRLLDGTSGNLLGNQR